MSVRVEGKAGHSSGKVGGWGRRLLCAAMWLAAGAAQAGYPERPVTLLVPYAAGGPMDKLARQLGARLSQDFAQPVVVQNVSGAGGNVGVAAARRAKPDGYTVLIDHIHMATAPALYDEPGFDAERDFAPLGVMAESPLVLVSRHGLPFADAAALRRWLAKSGQANMANAGMGSASHLCGLLLQGSLQARVTSVPYKGTGPAMADLLGGRVDLMCDLTANALPQIAAGKLEALAVTVDEPLAGTALAETPSLRTFGIDQAPLTIWYGLYAPAGTPSAIQQRVSAALGRAVADASFRAQQEAAGVRLVRDDRLTSAGHRRFLQQELARWRDVIRARAGYGD